MISILENAKSIFRNKDYQVVFKNFISLSFLQAADYIVPLIAIPYILRIIDAEKFGVIMFAQAFVLYFDLLVDFGFDYISTKRIAIKKNSLLEVKRIFYTTIFSKLFLLIISFILFNIIVPFVSGYSEYKLVFYISFIAVFGKMLAPVWLFQGIENMKTIAIVNIISKGVSTLAIFYFLKNKEDYIIVPLLFSCGFLLNGIITFIMGIRYLPSKIYKPNFNEIFELIKSSKDVFITNLSSSLYLQSNSFILGSVTGDLASVGFYAIAEKSVRGIRYLITPITRAIYPYFSRRFNTISNSEAKSILFRFSYLLTPMLIVITICVIYFSDFISVVLYGVENENIIRGVIVLSVIIIIGTFNNVLGIVGMINMNMEKNVRNSIALTGIFSILLCTILSYGFNYLGACISAVTSEMLLLIFFIYRLNKV